MWNEQEMYSLNPSKFHQVLNEETFILSEHEHFQYTSMCGANNKFIIVTQKGNNICKHFTYTL